ncbi:flagellar basal body P-ring formation chaperone FlgA [Marivita sp. GX14005]|uniref:flagellar basal body P-ring formation chaperone FlgA n=1 Tax=Marivita sp. GX14005 TaxID=2942276 RepID=UPI0020193F1A|nr:flagellar basal body P-ring formation chaperone FlgA [Marivita sp. GX14005]MCL3881697.1 flagellar basal body P-ring formation chaperone FlgA [Marivita sp. GX14005]
MRAVGFIVSAILASAAQADSVVAVKTIRPKEVIAGDSVQLQDAEVPGAVTSLDDAIGFEVKRAVYAGRAVMAANLIQAAVVERNQVVPASFTLNGLTIDTEARALERGSAGDIIRAMNLSSRMTIQAEVQQDGWLKVLP